MLKRISDAQQALMQAWAAHKLVFNVDQQKILKKINLGVSTYRLVSWTGKRRSSAALASQPIRHILELALAACSASEVAMFARGCRDMALQMRRVLILMAHKGYEILKILKLKHRLQCVDCVCIYTST